MIEPTIEKVDPASTWVFEKKPNGECRSNYNALNTFKITGPHESIIEVQINILQYNDSGRIKYVIKDWSTEKLFDKTNHKLIEVEYLSLLPEVKKQNQIIKMANTSKEFDESWVHQFIVDMKKLDIGKELTFKITQNRQDYLNGIGGRGYLTCDVIYNKNTCVIHRGSDLDLKSKYAVYIQGNEEWRSTSDLLSTVFKQIKRDIPIYLEEEIIRKERRRLDAIQRINNTNTLILEERKSFIKFKASFPLFQNSKVEKIWDGSFKISKEINGNTVGISLKPILNNNEWEIKLRDSITGEDNINKILELIYNMK